MSQDNGVSKLSAKFTTLAPPAHLHLTAFGAVRVRAGENAKLFVIASKAKQSPHFNKETPALLRIAVQVLLRRHKTPPRNDNTINNCDAFWCVAFYFCANSLFPR